MTSGGLGQTDIGNFGTGYIQGVAREFYTRVGQKYGWGAKFTFELHVAETVFNEMARTGRRKNLHQSIFGVGHKKWPADRCGDDEQQQYFSGQGIY